MPSFSDSLRGYGREIFERDSFVCAYCKRDHSSFDLWLFLTVDHLLPKDDSRREHPEWKVTACSFCNTARNRTKYNITETTTPAEIVAAKLAEISTTLKAYESFWNEHYGKNQEKRKP